MRYKLQEMRKRAGYKSARAFAERMGMSVSTYTNYEQGVRALSLEQAWEFADVLDCTLDELAGRDFQPPGETIAYEDSRQERMNSAFEELGDETKDIAASAVVAMAATERARCEEPVQADVSA